MTKPRFTPDPAPEGTDPELVEFVQREFERMDDLWPEDLESRLEALETTWPYLTGTWPLVDLSDLNISNTYRLKDFAPTFSGFITNESGNKWEIPLLSKTIEDVEYAGSGGFGARSNVVKADNGRVMYVNGGSTGTQTCYFSDNGGQSFSARGTLNDAWYVGGSHWPWLYHAASQDKWYYIACQNSPRKGIIVYESDDNGLTWSHRSTQTISQVSSWQDFKGFCARDDNYWVLAPSDNIGYNSSGDYSYGKYVSISTNQGQSWSAVRTRHLKNGDPNLTQSKSTIWYDHDTDTWVWINMRMSGNSTRNYMTQPGPNWPSDWFDTTRQKLRDKDDYFMAKVANTYYVINCRIDANDGGVVRSTNVDGPFVDAIDAGEDRIFPTGLRYSHDVINDELIVGCEGFGSAGIPGGVYKFNGGNAISLIDLFLNAPGKGSLGSYAEETGRTSTNDIQSVFFYEYPPD